MVVYAARWCTQPAYTYQPRTPGSGCFRGYAVFGTGVTVSRYTVLIHLDCYKQATGKMYQEMCQLGNRMDKMLEECAPSDKAKTLSKQKIKQVCLFVIKQVCLVTSCMFTLPPLRLN